MQIPLYIKPITDQACDSECPFNDHGSCTLFNVDLVRHEEGHCDRHWKCTTYFDEEQN